MVEARTLKLERIEPDALTLRQQVGTLCWKVKDGRTRILLITSRETGRWVIPKGWPMEGLSDTAAAQREAWEEAGVVGTALDVKIGTFRYAKILSRKRGLELGVPCEVTVYPVHVEKLARSFPEAKTRERKWFSPRKAASLVEEGELATLILGFDPAAMA